MKSSLRLLHISVLLILSMIFPLSAINALGADVDPSPASASIYILPVDPENNGISGATFRVSNEMGMPIDHWVTNGEPHLLTGLNAGEHYTLVETIVPDEYRHVANITFYVTDELQVQTDGDFANNTLSVHHDYNRTFVFVQHLRMVNGSIPSNPKYVVGSELHIEDTIGNIAKDAVNGCSLSWSTTDSDYAVALKAGTYKLVMDSVPQSLKKYYPHVASDITFIASEDGSIRDANGNVITDNTIKMYADFDLMGYDFDQTCGSGMHDWIELRKEEPTCGKNGKIERQCKQCQKVETEDLGPTGKHEWSIFFVKEGDSENEGFKLFTCKICGQLKMETIPKAGTVVRKDQTMTVKAKSPSVKASKLKKKKQTIKKAKAFTVKNAQGAVSFRKKSGSKKLSISSKGIITVKKGTKKGTYKMAVVVTAAGNAAYKAGTKTVTVKVKVK